MSHRELIFGRLSQVMSRGELSLGRLEESPSSSPWLIGVGLGLGFDKDGLDRLTPVLGISEGGSCRELFRASQRGYELRRTQSRAS